jgi:hypothetical protein
VEEYAALISLPCHYCGGIFGTVQVGIGLDRKDSSKGYSNDNVLSCCGTCNMIKGDTFTVEETLVAVKAILNYRSIQAQVQDRTLS